MGKQKKVVVFPTADERRQKVEKDFVTSIPLIVEVSPEDGIITDVGPYKHSVIWKEDGRSCVTYCNNCGSAFTRQGKLRSSLDPLERTILACASCGVFQGFPNKE